MSLKKDVGIIKKVVTSLINNALGEKGKTHLKVHESKLLCSAWLGNELENFLWAYRNSRHQGVQNVAYPFTATNQMVQPRGKMNFDKKSKTSDSFEMLTIC